MQGLADEGRAPTMIVIENVCGALTSHGGRDFSAIGSAIATAGYRFGALVFDVVEFVPQSRPRLFIVAVRKGARVPVGPTQCSPGKAWRTRALSAAVNALSALVREEWLWWRLPLPPKRLQTLANLIEYEPANALWHSGSETTRLLAMMSEANLEKVETAKNAGRQMVGTIYRRTRPDGKGGRVQRAEVRFDGVAGCLRTPQGGSSRQTVMIVQGNAIRSRLLAPREAARLMGLADTYKSPATDFLTSDQNEVSRFSG